jgi:nitrate/TMAO reductase-like tetraheme cytochrome c subunit
LSIHIHAGIFEIALALLLTLAIASAAAAQPKLEYSEERGVACLDCHETDQVMGILGTAHANFDDPRTPAAQRQCQSCHGPSKEHMQFPMQVKNVHFGTTSTAKPEVQNQACLACHKNGKAGWKASAHGFEQLVCSTCHGMHTPKKVVPKRSTVSKGCGMAGCHENRAAKSASAESLHPSFVQLEGKGAMICSDCHDPHAPLNSERCVDCHKQAPGVLAKQSEKAQRFHAVAAANETECMRCHRGIFHPLPADVLEAARREQQRDSR